MPESVGNAGAGEHGGVGDVLGDHRFPQELPRRAHNPILIASGLLDERTTVPWWNGRQLRFEIV